MVSSSAHWFPLLNGTSGFFPESYTDLIDVMRAFPDQSTLSYLAKRGVTYVLIHERYMSAEKYRAWIAQLETAPGIERLAIYFEGGYEIAAYRLTRSPRSAG
jgi:hypothetical protein